MSLQGKLVDVEGLAFGQVRLVAEVPHGRGKRLFHVELDVRLILRLAECIRGCQCNFEVPATGRRPRTLEEALSDPRYAPTWLGHAVWHLQHPENLMPCLPEGVEVVDVEAVRARLLAAGEAAGLGKLPVIVPGRDAVVGPPTESVATELDDDDFLARRDLGSVLVVQGERVQGLYVAGLHGKLSPASTPSVHGLVLVDGRDHLVRLGEPSSAGLCEVELGQVLEDGAPLPGEGTRLPQWEYVAGDVAVALAPAKIRPCDREVLRKASERSSRLVRQAVDALLRPGWTSPRPRLRTTYVDRCLVHVMALNDAEALLDVVREAIVSRWTAAVREPGRPGLLEASWELSRAARSEGDMLRAVWGLMRACSPDWQILAREGLPGVSSEDLCRRLDALERELGLPHEARR